MPNSNPPDERAGMVEAVARAIAKADHADFGRGDSFIKSMWLGMARAAVKACRLASQDLRGTAMTGQENERCETCRFWRDLHDDWARKGDCRRYPPTLGQDGKHSDYQFPKTISRNWCGEYTALSEGSE